VGILAVILIWFNTGFFGVQPTLISGVSMEPALNAGDVAITRDVPAEAIRPGDVIRFHEGGSHILHRVVEVRNVGAEVQFITQGDANNTVDAPVTYGRVRGKVILVLPKIGWVGIGVRELVAWIR
jgi:signal peptidase